MFNCKETFQQQQQINLMLILFYSLGVGMWVGVFFRNIYGVVIGQEINFMVDNLSNVLQYAM